MGVAARFPSVDAYLDATGASVLADLDLLMRDAYEAGDFRTAARLAAARVRLAELSAKPARRNSGLTAFAKRLQSIIAGPDRRK